MEQREGYFAAANGGTLFLDEVGELPLQTQARLLRVLETGEYIRVGSSEVRKTDVRIVAATNVNMEKAIEEGKFREDLFYRLNTVSIAVPALRERGADAALLFRKFALDMSEKYKMPAISLDEGAQRMLLAYSWPGNVRQLKNLAENMSVTAGERVITPEILSLYLPKESHSKQLVSVNSPEKEVHSFEAEREILYQILFDLRREVAELKRYVYEQRGGGIPTPTTVENNGLMLGHDALSVNFAHEDDADVRYWDAEEVKDEDMSMHSEQHNVEEGANKAKTDMPTSLDDLEREMVRRALEANKGRRKAAADQLGISERTLYRKIKEYGLE